MDVDDVIQEIDEAFEVFDYKTVLAATMKTMCTALNDVEQRVPLLL